MQVELNPRGNGACPFCTTAGTCPVQKTLGESLNKFSSDDDNTMELVIYSCPFFDEKD
jgi:hypothetical protein